MAASTHPMLEKLRTFALSLPETVEQETWGHPTFRAGKKIFATFGEHEGRPSMAVKSTRADQAILVTDTRRFFVPPYVGHVGWVGIFADAVAWDLAEDLVETSYRLVALKRMVKSLDASRR